MRTGRLVEAANDLEESLRFATESGELTAVALAQGFSAELAAVQGDGALALSRALRARETAAEAEATSVSALTDLRLGRCSLLAGDAREAAGALERSMALMRLPHTMGADEAIALGSLARGDRAALPFVHEERAALARLLGDEGARERELREAQRLFAEIGTPLQVERLAREFAP
jgi:hypothetical protein